MGAMNLQQRLSSAMSPHPTIAAVGRSNRQPVS